MEPFIQQQNLYASHRVALLVMSLLLLGVVIELVRRDYLKERYALLWAGTALAGLAVGVYPGFIVKIAEWLQFQFLTVLFVYYFIFTLGLVLAFSVVLSRLTERHRELTQEVALLAERLERIEKDHET